MDEVLLHFSCAVARFIPKQKAKSYDLAFCFGAGGGGRTRTLSPGLDFESSTSAYSITPAEHLLL